MFSSEHFGRIFWVDDNLDLKSCPLNEDDTGDFSSEDYVVEWDNWNEVNIPLLLNIYKVEMNNRTQYAGSITYRDSYKREVI